MDEIESLLLSIHLLFLDKEGSLLIVSAKILNVRGVLGTTYFFCPDTLKLNSHDNCPS
jgi:hypothetical protein